MNIIELDETLLRNPHWTTFAAKLRDSIANEYQLDGVTIVLRELTEDEAHAETGDLLTFNQDSQRFEFALGHGRHLPAAWKVADRIDGFLNPDPEDA
jgi:hypothetical protein